MIRSHKTITAVMIMVFCLSFAAPLFVVDQASAASAAIVEQSNVVGAAAGQNTGVLKITIPSTSVPLAIGSQVSISWPSEIIGTTAGPGMPVSISNTGLQPAGQVAVSVPAGVSAVTTADLTCSSINNSTFTVTVNTISFPGNDLVFYVHFANMNCTNYAGDIPVNVLGIAGGQFTTQNGLIVGTVKKDIGTNAVSLGQVQVTSAGGYLNTINLFENAAGALANGEVTLEIMTSGFTFGTPSTTTVGGPLYPNACGIGEWGWGPTLAFGNYDPVIWVPNGFAANNKLISISPAGVTAPTAYGIGQGYGNSRVWAATASPRPGWIQIGTLSNGTINGLYLQVDDSVARPGQDVEIRIRSTGGNGGITEQTLVVARYVDYESDVNEGTTTEILAGWSNQELGEFYIEEGAKNTLIQDRTIILTLPEGVRWDVTSLFSNSNYEVANASAFTFSAVAIGNYTDRDPENMNGYTGAAVWAGIDGGRTLKLIVNQSSAGAQRGAKIKFKKLKVLVSPAFSGDVVVEISGNAGATGSARVAEAIPAIEMTADDGTVPEVGLGIENQKCSDVTITETKAGALAGLNPEATEGVGANQKQWMRLSLDGNYYSFSEIPTITVESGDIVIGQPGLENDNTVLAIPIKGASYSELSSIRISNIMIDSNRMAPTGAINLRTQRVTGDPPNQLDATNVTGSFAQDRAAVTKIASMTAAPPYENQPQEPNNSVTGISVTFKVGSSFYTVNGIPKAMDAASYSKFDRTFVPMRYMGYAIGLKEAQVIWDNDAQTVTLTDGETTAVFTVGQKTYEVNGSTRTMDVAPEMKGDRVYLPARFVAESFGFVVAYDPATDMVIMSN